jgi:hypothetical protein
MKKMLRFAFVTAVVGLIGWRVIRLFSRKETMRNLRTLLGEEWIEREVLAAKSEHPLGKWHKKSPDNPITRYTEELVGVALRGEVLKSDISRLGSKLRSESVDTLTELGYAVFLTGRGFQVTMEPTAPLAGPDLLAVKGAEYYVEVRKVGLDEAHAAGDLATEDVFDRLCDTPSRHSVVISMTDEYSAHSPELKRAVRVVRSTLNDLAKRNVRKARLYYYGPTAHDLREGDEVQPEYDYADVKKLAAQIGDHERMREARFVAHFDDAGQESARTAVAVLPLGPHRYRLEPDQTYLRLRSILRKKQKQLPKGTSGIVVLDISDLGKLMIEEYTLSAALYGDLQMRIRAEPGFPHDMNRKPNGFFMGTTRISAVVIEWMNIHPDRVSVNREVFPTNNPQAKVLTLEELKLFGTIAEGLGNLCAEQL